MKIIGNAERKVLGILANAMMLSILRRNPQVAPNHKDGRHQIKKSLRLKEMFMKRKLAQKIEENSRKRKLKMQQREAKIGKMQNCIRIQMIFPAQRKH